MEQKEEGSRSERAQAEVISAGPEGEEMDANVRGSVRDSIDDSDPRQVEANGSDRGSNAKRRSI
jgi:hypothetical protein